MQQYRGQRGIVEEDALEIRAAERPVDNVDASRELTDAVEGHPRAGVLPLDDAGLSHDHCHAHFIGMRDDARVRYRKVSTIVERRSQAGNT